MQKFSVATSKGLIHCADFESAKKVLYLELQLQKEKKKRQLEEEKRKPQDWDKSFEELLEQYTPKDKEMLLKKKYEGGE